VGVACRRRAVEQEEGRMDDAKGSERLQGKRVVVTGAGTGIGRGIALEFGRAGAAVVLHYSHSRGGADETVAELCRAGGRAVAVQADFAQVAQVRQLAAQALEFLGGVDVLVNNAGITMNRPFDQVEPEQFDLLYQVNVRAPFFLTQALLPALIESRGAVINLSSIHAFEGYPEHSVYAGTKGALVAYTRELAVELALKGVRVNAIAPGSTAVENHYKVMPGLDLEASGRNIPCGFVGLPQDIAKVALFLASEDARYIVGQTLVVDGGTTAWMPFCDAFRQPMGVQFGQGYVPGL
jgi:NAD(P)-dependent dehydrogenase (short-subunit alcohol dehydrogenase family)